MFPVNQPGATTGLNCTPMYIFRRVQVFVLEITIISWFSIYSSDQKFWKHHNICIFLKYVLLKGSTALWVLSGLSSLHPPSKNMHIRLIGDSKWTIGVSVHGSFSHLPLCWTCDGLAWPGLAWPVQGVTCPFVQWQPWVGLSGYRKWMNGWLEKNQGGYFFNC